MQDSDIPTKISVPFAKNAGGSFTRTVPIPSQIGINAGFASFTDGFVPLNFTAIGAGGIPPFGQDMNGVLNAITKWTNWYNAGGPVAWDSAFSTAIGGYPKGAIVASVTVFGKQWLSTAENNTTNPDTGGANWVSINPALLFASDTGVGGANVYQCTYSPPITVHTQALIIAFAAVNNNTGASTINVGPGVKSLVYLTDAGFTPLLAGMICSNTIAYICYNGTSYQLLNPVFVPSGTTNVFTSLSGGSTLNDFSKFDASGNLIASGQSASGGAAKLLTISGPTSGGSLLQMDGSGNAQASFGTTGIGNIVASAYAAPNPASKFLIYDASGNIVATGADGSSFDAAGVAAALALWTWSGGATLALGSTNFAHGLALNPVRMGYRVSITCSSADAGYSVGDVIFLETTGPANSSNNLLTVTTDAAGNNTSVLIGVGVTVCHKSTFASTNLTLAKWILQIGVIPNH